MAQQTFDPSSKWLLREFGDGILYLAGAREVLSAKAVQPEVVQPRKLPDGLLEARLAGRNKPVFVLVEVATYPEERVVGQITDGMRLVRQVSGVLPEAVVVCLCPKGTYQVPEQLEETSPLGWTTSVLKWKVVEVWQLSAEELLAAPSVGVVPWATLANFSGAPEVLLQRCRNRIERDGKEQRANLLAVTQVFAQLHFNRPHLLEILGGEKVLIESPIIQELLEQSARQARVSMMLAFLESRFGKMTPNISAGLQQLKGQEPFLRLTQHAQLCSSIQAFEEALSEELPKPEPVSPRGRRKKKDE